MKPAESIKVVIHFQRRRDGGLRAWSDEVPGLVLSHKDPNKVMADVIPAVEVILSDMLGHPVTASPLIPVQEAQGSPVQGHRSRAGALASKRFDLFSLIGGKGETKEYVASACLA